MPLTFLPGDEAFYASDSPTSTFSGVFEDDGETGYFYAYDRAREEDRILDAMHILRRAQRGRPRDPVRGGDPLVGRRAEGRAADRRLPTRGHRLRRAARLLPQQLPAPRRPWRADERVPWDDSLMRLFDWPAA